MKPSERLKINRDAVIKLAKEYEQYGIHNLRVCGSVANCTDTEESDIDFIIDYTDENNFIYIGGLQIILEELLGCNVDLIPISLVHPLLKNKMLNEAKQI